MTRANEEPVIQDPTEVVVAQEEPQQSHDAEVPASEEQVPATEEPSNEILRRSQRVRKSAIPDDYEVYECEEIHIEGDPSSFKEAMSRLDASKWQVAMEDEMKSMSTSLGLRRNS
jgi:hypothetical protein